MQSKAKTVAEYLRSLPDDRRTAMTAVLDVLRANLDPEYEESMSYGMIGWCVPHRIFPDGYHCDPKQPLPYAGLASQKNYMSLYVMSVYGGGDLEAWVRTAWKAAGKKLDMGKCCIRFKSLDDVPLDAVAELARRVPARAWVAYYQSVMDPRTGRPKSSRKPAPKQTAGKKAAKKTAAKKVTKVTKAAPKKQVAAARGGAQQRRRK